MKELPLDSLEKSISALRDFRESFKAVPNITGDVCTWHMNDYLDMVKADYRRGWNDAIEGNSDLQASTHYIYGYDDAKEWRLSYGR